MLYPLVCFEKHVLVLRVSFAVVTAGWCELLALSLTPAYTASILLSHVLVINTKAV